MHIRLVFISRAWRGACRGQQGPWGRGAAVAAASFFGWGRRRRRGLGRADGPPQLPTLAATHHRPARQPRGRNLAPGPRHRCAEGTVLARFPRGCRCRVLFGVASTGQWDGGSDDGGEPSAAMAGSPALPGLQDPARRRAPCGRTATSECAGPAITAATEHWP